MRFIVYSISRALHTLFGFGHSCRYLPSCSEYVADAYEAHGALKGGWLGFKRLLRCSPLGDGGWDPVPRQLEKAQGVIKRGR